MKEEKDYVEDSEIYDIIIEHFRIVNDLLRKMAKKLKDHEDRIKSLENKLHYRKIDDDEDGGVLV